MTKLKTIYACQGCGAQFPKWQGQCSECGEWNLLVEEVFAKKNLAVSATGYAGVESNITLLSAVEMQEQTRLCTGLKEFDHVLGGGLISDSVVLIGGDPGIGKSTLLIQILCQMAETATALYITGEESLQQVALRSQRLGLPQENLLLFAETNVERIIAIAERIKPQVMVIDSIQTIFTDAIASAPGSVGQVRESAAQLVRLAKQKNIALFLVGHVTKDGSIAGPRVLEHMVDVVLYFEGQSDSRFRVIRAIKNRFGAINELGVFAMSDKGLKQVSNPSAIFLSSFRSSASGSIVTATWEGSRPLLVEVQALVDESHLANPRRVTVGLDQNRLSMLLAVLHRHSGVITYNQDVFANVVGGLRVTETSVDLALLAAIFSSLKNRPLPEDLIIFGEVGLSGEIRPVPSGQERLKEAQKHGFKRAIISKGNAPRNLSDDFKIIAVDHLRDALNALD